MIIATRWGYANRVGPILFGLCVLHTCDVPACHNDSHWFLGTLKDNRIDCWNKGRAIVPDNRGESHGMHKLTINEVNEIRSLYNTGIFFQKELAEKFGVAQQQISRIVRKKSWS